jgi:hypothetical protein
MISKLLKLFIYEPTLVILTQEKHLSSNKKQITLFDLDYNNHNLGIEDFVSLKRKRKYNLNSIPKLTITNTATYATTIFKNKKRIIIIRKMRS